MSNMKIIRCILSILLLTLLVGLSKAPLISVNGNKAVFLLLAVVLLWNTRVIPGSYASFFILVLMASAGNIDLEQVLAGFANPGLFFLLTVTLIGLSFDRRGIVGHLVLKWAEFCRSARSSLLYCMAVTVMMPLIIPAATVRTRLTEPIIRELAIMNGFGENGRFVRSSALIVGGMSSVATLAYMTGGGNSIVASQLIGSFTSTNVSWFLWVTFMLPLAWLIIFLCTVFLPPMFPGKEPGKAKVQIS
ncbi:MAG: anion permease [Bacillota bacterium]